MRSKVDLPQPDGPRMAMKSLSATRSVRGSSACVGAASALAGGKVRDTPSMTSLLMCCHRGRSADARRAGTQGPKGSPLVALGPGYSLARIPG
jgi:hypothetical protein